MRILLSIKPEYANKIFDGTKKYEFRRTIFKDSNVNTVVVYASSPVQRVIGEFTIEKVLSETTDKLWSLTNEFSGITKDFFDEYFGSKEIGYAIKVREIKKYKVPKLLVDFDINFAPQSFVYLS
jgi:predicted transcriptional regulator